MRAMMVTRGGGPDVLKLVDTARPEPLTGEILVRVYAAGVNPTDWKTRANGATSTGESAPFVIGADVAGVVEAVGTGVTIFAPGDAVYGMPRFPHPGGGYAEYLAAPARHFAPMPSGLSFVEAAALPLAGLTAWQSLVDTAHLQSGQRVLIHAASGGVGHLAVQISKALGAYVIGTASSEKHDRLRELGIDEVIDYRTTDFTEVVEDVDVVLDAAGGDTGERSLAVLRIGGHVVSIRTFATDALAVAAAAVGSHGAALIVEPDRAGLIALRDLVEAGQLHPLVDTVFPLEQARDAHVLGESGKMFGKIVLSVRDEASGTAGYPTGSPA